MDEEKTSSIVLKIKTKERLAKYGTTSETYEDVIIKLMNEYDKKKR